MSGSPWIGVQLRNNTCEWSIFIIMNTMHVVFYCCHTQSEYVKLHFNIVALNFIAHHISGNIINSKDSW